MAPHEDANAVLDWYDLPDPDGLDHFLHVDLGTVIGGEVGGVPPMVGSQGPTPRAIA